MAKPLNPIPEGYHTLTPYLTIHDGAGSIDFYNKAFGASGNHGSCQEGGSNLSRRGTL